MSESKNICNFCGSTDFYLEDGFYFCTKCQTQNEEIREQFLDIKVDNTIRLKKIKIKTDTSGKTAEAIGWTSWELYNFVLIGITNEVIEIGAKPDIKLTVLQLWSLYLSKLEVAFTSKSKKSVPRLSRRYHRRDAEIIYGKILNKKKRKRRGSTSASSAVSSFTSEVSSSRQLSRSKKLMVAAEYDRYLSQASSDTQQTKSCASSEVGQSTIHKIKMNKRARLEAKKITVKSKKQPLSKRKKFREKYTTRSYKMGPDVITPLKLWSLVYLALRIHNENIYLSDILRFFREGHLSYYKLDHLLPQETSINQNDVAFLTQNIDISHKRFRITVASLAKFLNVNEMAKPDIMGLIQRYCEDLNLPRGILLYAERLYLSCPSEMKFSLNCLEIPNYEGRAMAYIIVVFKTLFCLDGITEIQISRVAEKLNRIASENGILESKLFSYCEWERYIECRKNVLLNFHFPTKVKNDFESCGNSHLYLRFMAIIQSKGKAAEGVEVTNSRCFISQNLIESFTQCMENLKIDSVPLKEMEIFMPSLTPHSSYICQLKESSNFNLPSYLNENFYDTKVGYMTHTQSIKELALQCGINLIIINRGLHYLEKKVPPCKQKKLSLPELQKFVRVVAPKENKATKENMDNLLNYTNKYRPCELKINFKKLKYFSSVVNKKRDTEDFFNFDDDDCYSQILPDGRLKITDSDSDNESISHEESVNIDKYRDSKCLLDENFCKKFNIELCNYELESVKTNEKYIKNKISYKHDSRGKFMKLGKKQKKSSEVIEVKVETLESSEDTCTEESISCEKITNLPNQIKKQKKDINKKQLENDNPFDLHDSDISILGDEDISDLPHKTHVTESEILFRPYKDYWIYDCIFSNITGKNFELLEKELPASFLRLLSECASIVEMTNEDLYEEVRLIESFHLQLVNSEKKECTKLFTNNVLKKW